MVTHAPVMEWQICEDDQEWEAARISVQLAGLRQPVHSTGRPWRCRRWALAALLAVLLPTLISGYHRLRSVDQAMDRVEANVRTAVAAERWVQQHTVQMNGTRPSPEIAHGLGAEARNVEVRDDYAMVEVWMHEPDTPWLPAPYRQTRFFQETEQGWLPTEPPDLFWQPLESLQVGRFIFVYGPRDAGAVLDAADQAEALDAELRAELGLPPANKALTVTLLPTFLPSLDPIDLARMSEVPVSYAPSPALLRLPAHISEGNALLQLVAGLLVQLGLDEALTGSPSACVWRSLDAGLHLWLLREHSELPSQSHYSAGSLFHAKLAHGFLPRLTWLGPDQDACSFDPTTRGSESIDPNDGGAENLVDYAFAAYGRDRLSALIDGMRRYATWEDLIPAVFGVSAADFETGWQDYLRKDNS